MGGAYYCHVGTAYRPFRPLISRGPFVGRNYYCRGRLRGPASELNNNDKSADFRSDIRLNKSR